MKKKGQLFYASKEINGEHFEMFYWAKLSRDQYMIVIPRTFKKDPHKFKYALISEKKFKRMTKEYVLQDLT